MAPTFAAARRTPLRRRPLTAVPDAPGWRPSRSAFPVAPARVPRHPDRRRRRPQRRRVRGARPPARAAAARRPVRPGARPARPADRHLQRRPVRRLAVRARQRRCRPKGPVELVDERDAGRGRHADCVRPTQPTHLRSTWPCARAPTWDLGEPPLVAKDAHDARRHHVGDRWLAAARAPTAPTPAARRLLGGHRRAGRPPTTTPRLPEARPRRRAQVAETEIVAETSSPRPSRPRRRRRGRRLGARTVGDGRAAPTPRRHRPVDRRRVAEGAGRRRAVGPPARPGGREHRVLRRLGHGRDRAGAAGSSGDADTGAGTPPPQSVWDTADAPDAAPTARVGRPRRTVAPCTDADTDMPVDVEEPEPQPVVGHRDHGGDHRGHRHRHRHRHRHAGGRRGAPSRSPCGTPSTTVETIEDTDTDPTPTPTCRWTSRSPTRTRCRRSAGAPTGAGAAPPAEVEPVATARTRDVRARDRSRRS